MSLWYGVQCGVQCAVSLWCGVSSMLTVWCACVVCSVPLWCAVSTACGEHWCAVSLWCGVSYQCGVLVCVQCASLVCSELVVWCELSAAHIGHKSSSNQDINGNLKVL